MIKGVVVSSIAAYHGPNWELCEFCVRGLASALFTITPATGRWVRRYGKEFWVQP